MLSQTHDTGYRLITQGFGNGVSRQLSDARLANLRTRDFTSNNSGVISSLDFSYSYNVDKQVTAESTAGSFLDDSSFTASYDAGDRLKTWSRAGQLSATSR